MSFLFFSLLDNVLLITTILLYGLLNYCWIILEFSFLYSTVTIVHMFKVIKEDNYTRKSLCKLPFQNSKIIGFSENSFIYDLETSCAKIAQYIH